MTTLSILDWMYLCTFVIFVIGVIGVGMVFATTNKEYKRAMIELKRYEINSTTTPYGDNLLEALDAFIDNCFTDYRIKFLLPDDDLYPKYVTDEDENRIRADLVKIVSDRISPIMLERLLIHFNEEAIGAVLADKIYFTVMYYAIESRSIRKTAKNTELNNFPKEMLFSKLP